MIRYLAIRNLAVIESAVVEFEPSFNILTGETGAGKSILVEAVGLLLGGRAAQDLLRTGEDLAKVEAVFDTGTGRPVTVRRELTSQGRSRAFIDGALATAAALKDLSNQLVELHGQLEHQVLLDPQQHLLVLDDWAGLGEQRGRVTAAFAEVRELRQQIDRMRMDDRERAARLELVDFQLHELRSASLAAGEDEHLAAERGILRNAARIQQVCRDGYAALYEDEHAVLASLDRVWKRVGELVSLDAPFGAHLEPRERIKAELEDLAFALRDFGEGMDASPGRLQQVEDRLALLERLKRKYGPTLDDVIARRDRLSSEHDILVGRDRSPAELDVALRRAAASYLDVARDLSERRRRAGEDLGRALERELGQLAMEGARFEVRMATRDREDLWSERGLDEVEFFFSANVGEDPRPLARIVSGGELSRVMLALKTLSAGRLGLGAARTLIFDEVDAGIGGRVATVVGEKLALLGDRFQVLCITHLPQIAAYGRTHFLIEKHRRGRRTATTVTRLDREARIGELARMMGGAAAGAQALAGARELLAAAEAKGEHAAKAKGESRPRRKAKRG